MKTYKVQAGNWDKIETLQVKKKGTNEYLEVPINFFSRKPKNCS